MKIPLYNQTGQPSVQTKAQQLSPRASAGVFTSQGQAMAQLGQQIAQTGEAVADNMIRFRQQQEKIEFDFAMAEKQAETERALDEARIAHNEQAMKFIEENKDTDTTAFRTNYDTFNKDFLSQNIDTRADLTDKQKQAVRSGLSQQIISKGNAGAKNAFDRAQVIRLQAAKDSIATMIQDASSYPEGHPERFRLEGQIEERILKAERDGLRTGYSAQSVKVSFERLDYDTQIRGASSFEELEAIDRKLEKSALGQQGRTTMRNMIKARKSELRDGIKQSNLTAISDLEVEFSEREALQEAIENGTPYYGVDSEGNQVVVDTSGMKQDARINLARSMIPEKFKGLSDTQSQEQVDSIVSSAEVENTPVETRGVVEEYYSQEYLNKTGKTKSDIDKNVVESASQMVAQASRLVASGQLDANQLALLNNAEYLLTTELGGNPALEANIETSKDARRVLNAITTIRGDLAKAEAERAFIGSGVQLFNQGRLNIQDIGATEDQKQAMIAEGLSQIGTLEGQINKLSDNDVEFQQWTRLLSAAKNRILDPSITTTSQDVLEALKIFEAISLQGRDGVYENHVKQGDRVFWNSWKTLTAIHEPEVAMDMMKQQRSDVDISVSFKTVADQVNTQGSELYEMNWFKSALAAVGLAEKTQMPENTQQITSFVSDLTKQYMKFGIDAEDALKMAATDYFKVHVPVGNVMLRKPAGQKFSEDLPEIREILVNKFLEANPDSPFEADDLSIMNVGDSVDIFRIVRDGGFPTSGYSQNLYTLSQMEDVLSQARAMADERRLRETKERIDKNMSSTVSEGDSGFADIMEDIGA